MKTFLLHLPESMMDEIDAITEELGWSKSQFIRQAIMRNLDITRNVEMPLIREHYRRVHGTFMNDPHWTERN